MLYSIPLSLILCADCSWTLSFSLLARIILLSATRTPQQELEQAERNLALPPDMQTPECMLVKTEVVRINREAIEKLIADKQTSFSRLPPPEEQEPDHSPTGLFAAPAPAAAASGRRTQMGRKRATLNHHLHQQATHRREMIKQQKKDEESIKFDPSRASRQSVVILQDGRGTDSESSKHLLAAVRTTNINTNFRNAQKLLVAMHKKENVLLEEEESESDESSDEEEEEGEEGAEEGEEDLSFMEVMRSKAQQKRQLLAKTITHPEEEEQAPTQLRKQSSSDSRNNFYLYADMMNEAESIELLSKTCDTQSEVKAGLLGSLSSKQDRRREQGKWRESKANEVSQFKKNIEESREYIDEVVRMYNLRATMSPTVAASSQQDFSRLWSDHIDRKEQKGMKNEARNNGKRLDFSEKKILSLLRTQETKQDAYSLRCIV
jgi:hypothetical protein